LIVQCYSSFSNKFNINYVDISYKGKLLQYTKIDLIWMVFEVLGSTGEQ